MDVPRVTVITAAYNSSPTLQVALESLRAQTFSAWEAWIVGDACTDDSEEVVRSFDDPRMNWINLESNHGSQAFPNNEGLRRAKGELIAYLGHDDLWLPRHLEDLMRVLDESRADFVHSVCGLFGKEGWYACKGSPIPSQTYEEHFIPPSCWMHRRDLIESVGYWADPATLDVAVDFEYSRRVHRAGKKIAFCPRLSVLKTPSHEVALYAQGGDPPQRAMWTRVRDDPEGFEYELLGAISAEVAQHQWGRPADSLWVAIRRVFGIVWRGVRGIYERSPVTFSRRRKVFQESRAANRLKRGLPPAGPLP